jgi:hypothetical protein
MSIYSEGVIVMSMILSTLYLIIVSSLVEDSGRLISSLKFMKGY